MPDIHTNSSFNIEGDHFEKAKSTLDFSPLHIFEVLENTYSQNSELLSAIEKEKDIYIEDNSNSFLITDELFRKPVEPIIPIQKEKITPLPKQEKEKNISYTVENKAIISEEITPVQLEEANTFVTETAPIQLEDTNIFVAETETAPIQLEETNIFIAETETAPVQLEDTNIFVAEAETAIFSQNKDPLEEEKLQKQEILQKNEIILRKKANISIKINVKEEEYTQFFDSKTHFSFTETENMSPETTSIIDTFLANEPKLTRYRINLAEKHSPVKDLLQEDDDEVVTETMAYLYASQGNQTEAIKIYEKLSLQIPEKKLYFAAQIKQLLASKTDNL